VTDRILIIEQDPADPVQWRYGLADDNEQLPQVYSTRTSGQER
jgi:hypothetical protein